MANRFVVKKRSLAPIALASAISFTMPAAQAEFGDLLHTFADADSTGDDAFGWSVAISEATAFVGNGVPWTNPPGPEKVHVFDLSNGAERYELVHSEVTAAEVFGYSVAIDGNFLIAGAGGSEAYLFDASTGQKTRQLIGATQVPFDLFGRAVAIDGDKAIVGAFGSYHRGVSGAAYVFDVTTGQELFKLTSADAPAGDQFGLDVDISGNIAIVGAPSQFADRDNAGAAYVFDITTGQEVRKLRAPNPSTSDNFGQHVAIEGNIAIVAAAPFSGSGGGVYVFNVTTGQELFKLVRSDGAEIVGSPVDISGNTAIVGAHLFDVTTGKELMKLTAPDPDGFGGSVAIHRNRAILGANRFGVPGAAYVFDVTRIHGDFNTDGAVDGADFLAWQNGLGTLYTAAQLDDWRTNFGQAAAAAAAVVGSFSRGGSGSIPEPTGAVLAALAFVVLPARARESLLR